MALFGNLEHQPLNELFHMLQTQTGMLYFHEAYHGRTLELTLAQGVLHALYIDGFPVQESARALSILYQLHHQSIGAFEFQRQDKLRSERTFALPLRTILRDNVHHTIPPDQLPHPDTRFHVVEAVQDVPQSLQHAWTQLSPHFAQSASASELAQVTRVPVSDLQVMLYHLRAVDLIAPVRAAGIARPTTAAPAPLPALGSPQPELLPATPAPVPLLQRMLGALRRLTGSGAA